MGKQNITDVPKTLYYCGEIVNLLLVFDPVSDDLTKHTLDERDIERSDRSLQSGHPSVGMPYEDELRSFDAM